MGCRAHELTCIKKTIILLATKPWEIFGAIAKTITVESLTLTRMQGARRCGRRLGEKLRESGKEG